MVKCSRKSVSLSDLWVTSHDKLSDFYASSWQRGDSAVPLLVVRLLALTLALGILGWSLYEGGNIYWLIYLTNWGLIFVSSMLISGVVVSTLAVSKKITETNELPWFVSSYWFLYNVGVGISFVITSLYWILLYDPEAAKIDKRAFWLDVMTHGFNSCLSLTELLVSRTPVKITHIYQPLGVGLWYAAFTGVYYGAGGKDGNGFPYIYAVIDWRQPKRTALTVTMSAVGLIVIYCIVYGIALCRDKLSTLLFRSTSVELTPPPPDIRTSAPYEFV